MSSEELIKNEINESFKDEAEVLIQRARRVKVLTNSEKVIPLLSFLKGIGFQHLVAISCVDWILEDEFELVYHLWSYNRKVHIMVKARIPRENPIMKTARNVFEHAQTYERDIHEFFGIEFPGNPRLIPMILEDWEGPPPMRKDFDTRKFAAAFYNMQDKEEEIYERKPQPFRGD